MKSILIVLFTLTMIPTAFAENSFLSVQGLARDGSWTDFPLTSSTVVCNVKATGTGSDSYLNIRDCASTSCKVNRSLFKNAIVMVSPGYQDGKWVKVDTAYRIFSRDGKKRVEAESLHVSGWAHSDYLCDFTNL